MFARLFCALALLFSASHASATLVPREPLEACRAMYSDRAEVSCLATIRGVADLLDRNGVGVCYRNTPDYTAIACLRQMAASPETVYHWGALNVCDSMTGNTVVNTCMRIVRNAASFSDAAVNVCAQRHSNVAKNRCLATIAGKTFADIDTQSCGLIQVDAQAIRCLRITAQLPAFTAE